MAKKIKMKTRSMLKQRVKISATGKIIMGHVGKRHAMHKRNQNTLRGKIGTQVVKSNRFMNNLIKGTSL